MTPKEAEECVIRTPNATRIENKIKDQGFHARLLQLSLLYEVKQTFIGVPRALSDVTLTQGRHMSRLPILSADAREDGITSQHKCRHGCTAKSPSS